MDFPVNLTPKSKPIQIHIWNPLLLGAFFYLIFIAPIHSQQLNPDYPIVFQNGNTITTDSLYPGTSLSSFPYLPNPVTVLPSGGILTGTMSLALAGNLTGTGSLTINLATNVFLEAQNDLFVENGFVLQSGIVIFGTGSSGSGSSVLNGPLMVTGNVYVNGNVVFTGNSIQGLASSHLNFDGSPGNANAGLIVFTGYGPDFQMNSSIDINQPYSSIVGSYLVFNNLAGVQTFGGTIGDSVFRVGKGGTTVMTASLLNNVSVNGGTLRLSGANGTISNPADTNTGVTLSGGTLVLDNTLANNNSRIGSKFLQFRGGNLTLMGKNGGATLQSRNDSWGSAPSQQGTRFAEGANKIRVVPGNGPGSSAVLSFVGIPTATTDGYSGGSGSVDFIGLGSNAKVIFTMQPAGAVGPWATFNGTDFAAYDITNGVVPLPASGRPDQISTAPIDSYVLGNGSQGTLTSPSQVNGVTMNGASTLDLGTNTLKMGAWIQNDAPATISNGKIQCLNFASASAIYFVTNSDLNVNSSLLATNVVKNGPSSLILTGSPNFGVYGINPFPIFHVNEGTLALNVSTPLSTGGTSYPGLPTIIIGNSAGDPGSATLSLLADNQFFIADDTGQRVDIKIMPAGRFLLNGHDATLASVEINDGKINMEGATLTTKKILANPLSTPGIIETGTLNLTGAASFEVNTLYPNYPFFSRGTDLITSAKLTASVPITKKGNGVLLLTNDQNSFGDATTGLTVEAGTVAFANSGATGSLGKKIVLKEGAGFRADSPGTLTISNPIEVVGSYGNTYTSNFSGSPLILNAGLKQISHGKFYVTNITTIVNYINNATDSNFLGDGKAGSGTLVLGGQASGIATGNFTLDNGTLAFDSNTPLPAGMSLCIAGGRIESLSSARTIPNPLIILENAIFSGSQAQTFNATSGNQLVAGRTRAIYVTATAPATIHNLSGLQSNLYTGGNGTLVLSGTPSGMLWTKPLSGTLRIKNTGPTGASLGVVTVFPSSTLGGTGKMVGGLTTVNGLGTLDPGDMPGQAGVLEFNSGLTLENGSQANFDLSSPTTSDRINITAGTFTGPSAGSIKVNLSGNSITNGTYTLFSWACGESVTGDKFTLGTAPAGYNFSLSVFNNTLYLTVVSEFSIWQSGHFSSQQLADPLISGPAAIPLGDGISNLAKYFYNINPIQPMTSTDRAALLSGIWSNENGLNYLTLTFRKNNLAVGVSYQAEESPDLQQWTPVVAAAQNIGMDATTGDPILEIKIDVTSAAKKFVRLRLNLP